MTLPAPPGPARRLASPAPERARPERRARPRLPPVRPIAFLLLLWLIHAFMIVYVSLAPFGPWEPWGSLQWRFLFAPLPRHITPFDLLINVLAYLPLGWLAAAAAARRCSGGRAVLFATVLAAVLSLVMESLQVLLPPRIPSNVDLVTNTLGALLGALPWRRPAITRHVLQALERWRDGWLAPGWEPEFGLLLVLLWCACQLNPSIPFLGAGVLRNPDMLAWSDLRPDPADWGLQALAAGLGLCGLGLFLACLVLPRRSAPLLTLVLLLLVMAAKATAAEWLLKPVLANDWFGSATLAGLASGAVLLVLTRRLRLRARAITAGVCLLAGGLLAKLGGHYLALWEMRSLFGWNFGQLRSFTGLTVWLNEIWPLLAVLFLALWWPRAPQVSSTD